MKLVVLERAFTPEIASSITYDYWMQVNHVLDGCLEARQVDWLYSLVSMNGDRSICLFRAPYIETVRESCRQARMPFQKVWAAELWLEHDPQSFPQSTALIVAEVNYDSPITKSFYEATKQQAKNCLSELNVQSAFSIIALDGTHSVCLFSAASAEDVRLLYRKVRMPFKHIWKAALIQSISTGLKPSIS